MASVNESGMKTFELKAATAKHLRVKADAPSGTNGTTPTAEVAGIGDLHIGTLAVRTDTSNELATVYMTTKPGTQLYISAVTAAVGDEMHTAAAGKVSNVAATGSRPMGVYLSAATAVDQVVEGGQSLASVAAAS